MLKFKLQEPHHVHGDPGAACDPHHRIAVGEMDFLNVALRDHVPDCGPPIPGHHHRVGCGAGHDGGAMRRCL